MCVGGAWKPIYGPAHVYCLLMKPRPHMPFMDETPLISSLGEQPRPIGTVNGGSPAHPPCLWAKHRPYILFMGEAPPTCPSGWTEAAKRSNESGSPSSLHSSGGLAFLASLGSNHDVVLVLWLRRERRERDGLSRKRGGRRERDGRRLKRKGSGWQNEIISLNLLT